MRRRPFSAGSSIEPDTSITASMRERSVSTAQARRISSWAAASSAARRRRDLCREAGDVEPPVPSARGSRRRRADRSPPPRRLRTRRAGRPASSVASATPSAVAPPSSSPRRPASGAARTGSRRAPCRRPDTRRRASRRGRRGCTPATCASLVTTTLGCGAVARAPNAALVDAGMDLPSSIIAPANWRGSSGEECPRRASRPARLAEDASGSGRIVGSVPPSTRDQVTGSLAIAAAFVAAAANTTGVVAIGSPTSTSGGVWPSDAAVAVMRSSQTLDSGTQASASRPPEASTAAVSAESCGLIDGLDAGLGDGVEVLRDVGERRRDRGVGDDDELLAVGAAGVGGGEERVQVAADPEEDAGCDDADDRECGDDGKDERAPRLLRRGLDGVTPHGHSKPDGAVAPPNPCAERVPPFRGRVSSV